VTTRPEHYETMALGWGIYDDFTLHNYRLEPTYDREFREGVKHEQVWCEVWAARKKGCPVATQALVFIREHNFGHYMEIAMHGAACEPASREEDV